MAFEFNKFNYENQKFVSMFNRRKRGGGQNELKCYAGIKTRKLKKKKYCENIKDCPDCSNKEFYQNNKIVHPMN
ncbi:hypothetical protein HZS_220 [Henneguya salminicola]|nr:hypothetical protein HZS_220 [Henneguya salminicola]